MLGKTHFAAGMLTGLVITELVFKGNCPIFEQLFYISATSIGSLLPDLDHPNSKFTQCFPIIGSKLYNYFNTCTEGLGDYSFRKSLSMHRGIAHSIFMLIPLIVGLSFTNLFIGLFVAPFFIPKENIINNLLWWFIAIAFLVLGSSLHLLMDMFTREGVSLIAPISNKHFSIAKLRTGSIFEKVIRFFTWVIFFYIVCL